MTNLVDNILQVNVGSKAEAIDQCMTAAQAIEAQAISQTLATVVTVSILVIGLIVIMTVQRLLSRYMPTIANINSDPMASAEYHSRMGMAIAIAYGLICVAVLGGFG